MQTSQRHKRVNIQIINDIDITAQLNNDPYLFFLETVSLFYLRGMKDFSLVECLQNLYIYIYLYINICNLYIYAYLKIFMYIYINICMYIFIYIYIHIYICVYKYTLFERLHHFIDKFTIFSSQSWFILRFPIDILYIYTYVYLYTDKNIYILFYP
jgi:hypothetical protein